MWWNQNLKCDSSDKMGKNIFISVFVNSFHISLEIKLILSCDFYIVLIAVFGHESIIAAVVLLFDIDLLLVGYQGSK